MKQPQITQTHWDVRSDRMAAEGQRSIPSVAGSAAHESAAGTVHAGPSPDGDIRDLFSFELQRLAGLSTRIAALSIRPKYGITAREWRALAVLKYLGKVPLQELAKHSGLLKSQMSRTVSAMIERGYIEKTANPGDGRSILLCLSAEGLDLSEQILDDSFERNEHMLSTLSQAERHMLIELLQRVTRSSTQYYHRFYPASGRRACCPRDKARPSPRHQPSAPPPAFPVDRCSMRDGPEIFPCPTNPSSFAAPCPCKHRCATPEQPNRNWWRSNARHIPACQSRRC